MAKRKIAECINIRINVGNYQHIELTKNAEEEIEFDSDSVRIAKEDALRDELVTNMIRSMKAIPERLGKGVDQAVEVQEAIQKAIPAWLENGPIPNIANGAKEKVIQAAAEQKNNKDSQIPIPEETPVQKIVEEDVKNLFEDDSPAGNENEKTKEAEKSEISEKTDKEDLGQFFDDDDKDLFE